METMKSQTEKNTERPEVMSLHSLTQTHAHTYKDTRSRG